MVVHSLSLFMSQAYLIETPDGLVLVDCGIRGEHTAILRAMKRLGRDDLKLILITHAHPDHCGSAAALKRLTGAPVAVHHLDAEVLALGRCQLRGPNRLKVYFTNMAIPLISPPALQADIVVNDGDTIEQFGLPGTILHTPGHTPGSCCLLLDRKIAIVGDLISTKGTVHIQRAFIDDWQQLTNSYIRLRDLNLETVYPGHGTRAVSGGEMARAIDNQLYLVKPRRGDRER